MFMNEQAAEREAGRATRAATAAGDLQTEAGRLAFWKQTKAEELKSLDAWTEKNVGLN